MAYRLWILAAALGMIAGCGDDDSAVDTAPVAISPMKPVPPPLPVVTGKWVLQPSGTSADVLAIAALDENRAWAADAEGRCLRTEDGGATWLPVGSFQPEGSSLNYYRYVNELQFLDASHGWALSKRALMSTSDGGATWTTRLEMLPNYVGQGMYSWFYTPVLESMSFIDPTTGWLAASHGATRHTTDGGETWTAVQIEEEVDSVSANAVRFVDSQTGWMAVSGKVYKTLDQGMSWQLAKSFSDPVTFLSAVDGTHAWALGGWYQTYFFRIPEVPAGQATPLWPAPFGRFQFVDNDDGWGVGTWIHHTSDGGSTWTVLATPQTGFNGIAMVNASVGWVVGDGGIILKTETGGR